MSQAAVVGAGLSGLTAGYRLQQAGWDVNVFEATDTPGGRVQTVRADGYAIDTGASALEVGKVERPTAPLYGLPVRQAQWLASVRTHGGLCRVFETSSDCLAW
jgi:protoporphyrinogen/coproporphyrinogen III oxidase